MPRRYEPLPWGSRFIGDTLLLDAEVIKELLLSNSYELAVIKN